MGYFMLGAGPTALQGHSQRAWAFWESVRCATLRPREPGACRQHFSSLKSFSVSVSSQAIEIVKIGQK